ncbi:MAG: preprotein translocase subunit SecA [Saprospiraceae bacterium]|nr:preprotein translocase subunit SecA [Saprospiraceae bacterium]
MINFFKKLFGTKYDKDVQGYTPLISEINNYFEQLKSLSNDDLRNKTLEFRQRIKDHLKGIDQDIENVHSQSNAASDIADKERLYAQLDKLKTDRNKHLEDVLRAILPEAFAVVKETSRRLSINETLTVTATDHDRDLAASKNYVMIEGDKAIWKNTWSAAGGEVTWNMVHYDVQLIGGMVLHDGKIAEMATGEGKTLVASLPAYLNGLSGNGVHIITVNDYLARRDSEWNGPLYEFLLLTVDCIDKYRPHSPERRKAYQCDITYGTNNEFGFDYLRDNMVTSSEEMVQRGHHYAMVDEVDSVLVDDARTPLIISGPVGHDAEEQEYLDLKPSVENLIEQQRKLATEYLSEAKKLFKDNIIGYEEGEAGLALLRSHQALPKSRPLIKYLSEDGVKVLLQKTENFYMQENSKRMPLVSKPLYFTIDEKNRNVELTEKGAELLAGKDDPTMFILPDITSAMMQIDADNEMSATDKEEAKRKLALDFSNKSRKLHAVQQLLKAYTLFEKDEEYVVINDEVKIVDEQTGRMMEGRRYSDGLHQALEAKENVKVGEHTQTYATVTLQNYFRMYHKLAGMTGTAETEATELWQIYKLDVVVIPTNRPIKRADKDDLVYKTSREKYNAVIEEIVALTEKGRPVLVGTTSVDISEKLSRMLHLRGIDHNVLNAKQHQREAEVVAEAGMPGKVTIATNMAGRGTDIKISQQVKDAGGLAIIGTERHDSRRVDRQLRGRAGRQGDPGTSQFYVSLEDNLMRLFQSERIAKLMDQMGHKDGEVIQHSMVTKSIERAQKRVEENNFGIRKRLLEYDDVMNIQREAIYKKRKNALLGERLSVDIHNMFATLADNIVHDSKQQESYDEFIADTLDTFGIDAQISAQQFDQMSNNSIAEVLEDNSIAAYNRKTSAIAAHLYPICKQVLESQGHLYKRIAIPFTDGSKILNLSADLREAVDTEGKSIIRDIEKSISLTLIDDNWKEHLRTMDELKESVQSASFEQKDPLVIYKVEAYKLFEQIIHKTNKEVISFLTKGDLLIQQEEENTSSDPAKRREQQELQRRQQEAKKREDEENALRKRIAESVSTGGAASTGSSSATGGGGARPQTVVRNQPKVGRNDLCPCGSGKKYKHCHGKEA